MNVFSECDTDSSSDMDETDHLLRSNSDSLACSPLCCCCCCCGGAGGFLCSPIVRMFRSMFAVCGGGRDYRARVVRLGKPTTERFAVNVVNNQKYNVITFLPKVLYFQFSVFLNLFFLVMAVSQFIPELRVGSLVTYWGPLCFVVAVTMVREGVDDWRRYRRDKELNQAKYTRMTADGARMVNSSDICVGDIILLEKNQRVPADAVLLRTSESTGSCFIRTDQLDGETDWKLRVAIGATQKLSCDKDLFSVSADIYAEKPQCDIHNFIGTYSGTDGNSDCDSLSLRNTLWANTVLASGTALAVVVYTGSETRSVMNNSTARSKMGLLDTELNNITKILFGLVVIMSIVMMCLKGWEGPWHRYLFRYILLFSYIIPLSLRVNLDLAKIYYSWTMQRDPEMPQAVVRSTTIPEELGRIAYLLSDKTGTLTQNEMRLKKVHVGKCAYSVDSFCEVSAIVRERFGTVTSSERESSGTEGSNQAPSGGRRAGAIRSTLAKHVAETVKAIALCHNVTPSRESNSTSTTTSSSSSSSSSSSGGGAGFPDGTSTGQAVTIAIPSPLSGGDTTSSARATAKYQATTLAGGGLAETACEEDSGSDDGGGGGKLNYQASSPDEVALVMWTEQVGLALVERDTKYIHLRTPGGGRLSYEVLQIFHFTSETKRMSIIVRDCSSGEIWMYMKGADTVMSSIVLYSDWLEEQCDDMAREGLRTLVVASKQLSPEQYTEFEQRLHAAQMAVTDRDAKVAAVVETIEREMQLLCLTGVEDKLQENVRNTMDLLRNAGVKVWMLTGDKLETAVCIAQSSRLVTNSLHVHIMPDISTRTEAHQQLNALRRRNQCALVIRGSSLEVCLQYYDVEFMELACVCSAVVVCRCSPTQKACVVQLIQKHTGKRCAAIGDGGNDVSMIQAADCGIGIVGKEGKQASMASDFSIIQFCHLVRLLLVHGRNSYRRSAALGQFVIHRGLIISTMQAVFSSVFYFASVALFQGVLMVGYTTFYTNFPIFALVLDRDVSDATALSYPELYKELAKGRSLSHKTFFIWVAISIYQGGILMYGAMLLFEDEFIHIVSIGFTALIITELLMVALTIRTWHYLMAVAEMASFSAYFLSMLIFSNIFDVGFITSISFVWKVVAITLVSCVPLYVLKFVTRRFSPPSYSKLS